MRWSPAILCGLLLIPGQLWAQFKEGDPDGAGLAKPSVQQWRAGISISATTGPCKGLVGTAPLPTEWPEQQIKVISEDVSPQVRMTTRMVEGGVKEMVVNVPLLAAGEEAHAIITMEITRSPQLPPTDTERYRLPDRDRLERSVRPYLATSPLIESTSPRIVAAAKEIAPGETSAWKKVEAIYDWTREKVKYENGPLKGALAALKDGTGDCEELTSLFIALCRASGIPARTVWVPGHCYPEFYLLDEKGVGHWFPCQAAGARAFGGIPEGRPILQKGDNFPNAQNPRDKQRYRSEGLRGAGGKPQVRFIREIVN